MLGNFASLQEQNVCFRGPNIPPTEYLDSISFGTFLNHYDITRDLDRNS